MQLLPRQIVVVHLRDWLAEMASDAKPHTGLLLSRVEVCPCDEEDV